MVVKVRRHRLKASMNLDGQTLEVSTRFSETTRAGRAAGYLNSGEIDQRTGIEIAIACLFAPLREAQEGANEEEIEDSIAESQTQWEHYMQMALSRCRGRSDKRKTTAKLQPSELKSAARTLEQVMIEPLTQDPGTDSEDDIDLQNEEL
jgi:hypothetical protein